MFHQPVIKFSKYVVATTLMVNCVCANLRLSGYVMMIVGLTLFMHIIEMHRHLFSSLIVASSAKNFSLVSINSIRKEKIWDRKLMEISP